MSSLQQELQRVASQHPETRKHLVPLLRKLASREDVLKGQILAVLAPITGAKTVMLDESDEVRVLGARKVWSTYTKLLSRVDPQSKERDAQEAQAAKGMDALIEKGGVALSRHFGVKFTLNSDLNYDEHDQIGYTANLAELLATLPAFSKSDLGKQADDLSTQVVYQVQTFLLQAGHSQAVANSITHTLLNGTHFSDFVANGLIKAYGL